MLYKLASHCSTACQIKETYFAFEIYFLMVCTYIAYIIGSSKDNPHIRSIKQWISSLNILPETDHWHILHLLCFLLTIWLNLSKWVTNLLTWRIWPSVHEIVFISWNVTLQMKIAISLYLISVNNDVTTNVALRVPIMSPTFSN